MTKAAYFLCSPSFGILDNWLPVIAKLTADHPDLKVKMIISKAGNLKQIDYDNPLIQLSDQYFDEIILKSFNENYLSFKSLGEAQKWSVTNFNKLNFSWIKNQVLSQKLQNIVEKILNKVEGWNQKVRLKKFYSNLSNFPFKDSVLLFDIYEEHKAYNQQILSFFSSVDKFSISHGIDINQDEITTRVAKVAREAKLICSIYSDKEVDYYIDSFNLPREDLIVTGIPRHSKEWSDFITREFPSKIDWDQYVFLISRSYCDYFPPHRKKSAIEHLKETIIEELGLQLVIKLHPKELNDGIYEKVLGKHNYGRTWLISKDHPFSIAVKAKFAITFYSGVAVDMIYQGVPCIEYLDLRKLEDFDTKKSLRDGAGIPVLSFRFLKLVMGASDPKTLLGLCKKAIDNRDSCAAQLENQYRKFFLYSDDNRSQIVSLISSKLNQAK